MTILKAPIERQASDSRSKVAATGAAAPRTELLACALIFSVALALRFWFNFIAPHVNADCAGDAWEYLSNAAAILQLKEMPGSFWRSCMDCLIGSASGAVRHLVQSDLQPLKGLSVSGPVYPIFILLSALATGARFDAMHPFAVVASQSILSSATCLIIAALGKYAWNRKVGLLAGSLAAVYPGFIINSGRLVTETFACFLLCLALLSIVRGLSGKRQSLWEFILLGTTCGAVQLTRSVLMLVSPFVIPPALSQPGTQRKAMCMASIALGFAFILGPWAAFQTLAAGRPALLVDRCGSFNFYVGNDIYTGGWLTVPLQTLNGAEKESIPQLAAQALTRNPLGVVRLSIDKIVRLYKFPFNDFRSAIGPLTFSGQVLFHQILLVLAACGLTLSLFLGEATRLPSRQQVWCRLLIAWALLIHFAYLPFEAIARYTLTAIPFVILFSAAGMVSLIHLSVSSQARRTAWIAASAACLFLLTERANLVPFLASALGASKIAACLVTSSLIKSCALLVFIAAVCRCFRYLQGNRKAACLFALAATGIVLPTICLQTRSQGRWYEWQTVLDKPGQKISQTIYLRNGLAERLASRQCYLMVDADGWQRLSPTASVRVNGQRLTAPIIPSLSLPDCIFWYATGSGGELTRQYEHNFTLLAMRAGLSAPDLRQWFLLPLPPSCLSKSAITVEIEQSGNSPAKLFGTYPTKKGILQIPNLYNYSWDKAFYGVESDSGLSDPRIDDAIARESCPESTADLSPAPGLQCGNYNIRLLASPAAAAGGEQFLSTLAATPPVTGEISVTGRGSYTLKLPAIPKYGPAKLWWGPEKLWLVRISGRLHGNDTARPNVGVIVCSQDSAGKKYRYYSPWTPSVERASREWVPFDFAFPVNPRAFPGRVSSIEAHCHARDPVLASVSAPPKKEAQAEFADVKLELLNMPELPTGLGYKIY